MLLFRGGGISLRWESIFHVAGVLKKQEKIRLIDEVIESNLHMSDDKRESSRSQHHYLFAVTTVLRLIRGVKTSVSYERHCCLA